MDKFYKFIFHECTWHSAFHWNTLHKWDFIDAKDFRCTMSIWECKWCASGNFSGKSFFCTLWYCVWGFYSNSVQCTQALLLNRRWMQDLSCSDLISLSLSLSLLPSDWATRTLAWSCQPSSSASLAAWIAFSPKSRASWYLWSSR